MFTLAGALLILAGGLGFAAGPQNSNRSSGSNAGQNAVRTKALNQIFFVDQNGDGICDLAYDHDNDGIPNGQDPDFQRPQDGTGQMKRNGKASSFGFQSGKGGMNMNKLSFRNGAGQFHNGMCTGSGSRGQAKRHGKR